MRSSWASLRRDPRLLLVLAALVVVVGRLKGSGSSFSFVPFANAARSFARSSSATSSASSQQLAASGEAISTELLEHPKLLSLSRKDPSQPSVFIAIGSAPKKHELRDTVRATWLAHCKPPSCGYRFFTDDNYTLGDHLGGASPNGDGVPADVVTTPADEGGYAHFGIRALQQMEWSLRHVDFDHYLRLDDDGMLCVDHLMHDLKQLPLTRLFWGKYWCQHMARMDENYMLMSRDVAFVFASGWRSGKLPFRQQMSMDKLTANLQPMMGLDVVGDANRLRWLGPVLQLPGRGRAQEDADARELVEQELEPKYKNEGWLTENEDEEESWATAATLGSTPMQEGRLLGRKGKRKKRTKFSTNAAGNVCLGHYERRNTYNITEQELRWEKAQQLATTWAACPDICHRFVWLHHLAPAEIWRLYNNSIPFDPASPVLANLPSLEERAERPTQCRGWKGFPLFNTAKTSGHQVQRREVIQNSSCFWTWCTENFGGKCCNRQHKNAMRATIESLFSAYSSFDSPATRV